MAGKQIYTNLDLMGVSKVINMASGVDASDAVTKQQLEDAIAALNSGLIYAGKLDLTQTNGAGFWETVLTDTSKGDLYVIEVGGTMTFGDASTLVLAAGDMIVTNIDVAGVPGTSNKFDVIDNTTASDVVVTGDFDGVTIEVDETGARVIRVKDGGISFAKIASAAIASDLAVAAGTTQLARADAAKAYTDALGTTLEGLIDGVGGDITTHAGLSSGVHGVVGTIVGTSDAQTLNNKTIDAASNTLSNITLAMFAANVIDTDLAMAADSASRLVPQSTLKSILDTRAQGYKQKVPARAATTDNINLATFGLGIVDDVQLVDGDRVVVRAQTDKTQNGVYLAHAGAWTRATDFDDIPDTEINGGEALFVTEGTVYGDTGHVVITNAPIVVGTDIMEFEQYTGAGQLSAGNGIAITGGVVTAVGDESTITIAGGTIAIKNGGVTFSKLASAALITDMANASTTTLADTSTLKTYIDTADGLLDTAIGDVVTDLGTHTSATSAHGVTGAVVGTTDTQALTNKTFNASLNTLSNVTLAMLASGVLSTSVGSAPADDTTIYSALALHSYLTNLCKELTITGDGTTTSFNVDHNQASNKIVVQVADALTGQIVEPLVTKSTSNRVVINFTAAPANGKEFKVIVVGK